jgi:hypothetical protein
MLITCHKMYDEDTTTLDASFQKSLYTRKGIIALANNILFAGFYVVTPNKCRAKIIGRCTRNLWTPPWHTAFSFLPHHILLAWLCLRAHLLMCHLLRLSPSARPVLESPVFYFFMLPWHSTHGHHL